MFFFYNVPASSIWVTGNAPNTEIHISGIIQMTSRNKLEIGFQTNMAYLVLTCCVIIVNARNDCRS